MTAKEVIKSTFYALATVAVGLICYIANDGLSELKGIKKEMSDLNVKMVSVIKDQEWQNKTLTDHEQRLRKLEGSP